jgi:hypothetical protein
MGSDKDINANYLEAEFDWLAKALVDIPTARAIAWIKRQQPQPASAAPRAGEGAQQGEDAAAASTTEREDRTAMVADRSRTTLKGFGRNIAMGFKFVEDAIQTSHMDIPPQLQSSFDALGGGRGDPFPFLSWLLDNNQPGANGAAVILKAISQRRVFEAQTAWPATTSTRPTRKGS